MLKVSWFGLISHNQMEGMHFWLEYHRSHVFFSGHLMTGHILFYDTMFMLLLITSLRCYLMRLSPENLFFFFFLWVNKYLGRNTRDCENVVFFFKFCSLILVSTSGSCLQQFLLWCSIGNFVFPAFSLYLLGSSLWGRTIPSSSFIYIFGD